MPAGRPRSQPKRKGGPPQNLADVETIIAAGRTEIAERQREESKRREQPRGTSDRRGVEASISARCERERLQAAIRERMGITGDPQTDRVNLADTIADKALLVKKEGEAALAQEREENRRRRRRRRYIPKAY